MKFRKITVLLKRKDLLGISGMTTELGYTTKRTNLSSLKDCEDWLRNNPKNSINFIFDREVVKIKI